jgi:hypothetical protein
LFHLKLYITMQNFEFFRTLKVPFSYFASLNQFDNLENLLNS